MRWRWPWRRAVSPAILQQQVLESVLARLYTDAGERERFLLNPQAWAEAQGVDAVTAASLCGADLVGIDFAAASIASKRRGRGKG